MIASQSEMMRWPPIKKFVMTETWFLSMAVGLVIMNAITKAAVNAESVDAGDAA